MSEPEHRDTGAEDAYTDLAPLLHRGVEEVRSEAMARASSPEILRRAAEEAVVGPGVPRRPVAEVAAAIVRAEYVARLSHEELTTFRRATLQRNGEAASVERIRLAEATRIAEDTEADPFLLAWGESKRGEPTFDFDTATTILDRAYRFLAPTDTEELFVWEDGMYVAHGAQVVGGLVEASHKRQGLKAGEHDITEVVHALVRRHYIERSSFNPDGWLPLANGVLELATLTVRPHDPTLRFTFKLPVSYTPDATCPTFETFIGQLFPEPKDCSFIQEWFGANLTPGNRDQILVVLTGAGSNGKSTLLGALGDLLGSENVSSQSLQALAESSFARAELWGRLANIAADLPSDSLRRTGWLKTLTGGDRFTAEQKYKRPFSFVNRSHLTFACNTMPEVPDDDSYALWRRVIILHVEFTVSRDRADRDLPSKLRTELSGILNWSLTGARSLATRGRFDPSGTVESYMAEWQHRSNSLRWFTEEGRLVLGDPTLETTKDAFQEAYESFCEDHKAQALSKEVVGKKLPDMLRGVRSHRKNVSGGGKIAVWLGVGLLGGQAGQVRQGSSIQSHTRAYVESGCAPPVHRVQPVLDGVSGFDLGAREEEELGSDGSSDGGDL